MFPTRTETMTGATVPSRTWSAKSSSLVINTALFSIRVAPKSRSRMPETSPTSATCSAETHARRAVAQAPAAAAASMMNRTL